MEALGRASGKQMMAIALCASMGANIYLVSEAWQRQGERDEETRQHDQTCAALRMALRTILELADGTTQETVMRSVAASEPHLAPFRQGRFWVSGYLATEFSDTGTLMAVKPYPGTSGCMSEVRVPSPLQSPLDRTP